MDALLLEGVHVDFPTRPGVLAGVDLQVAPGEVAVVQGPSGSGKSTLLAAAAGLEPLSAGRIEVLGEPMDARRPEEAAQVRHRHVGLVFQHLNLLGELNVLENVALPLRLQRRRDQEGRAEELVERFGLGPVAHRLPGRLSGGEQQRAAIARALALRPGVLLVDEPTSALDQENADQVVRALTEAAAEGAAVVVATHDPRLLGIGTLHRMHDGRLRTGAP